MKKSVCMKGNDPLIHTDYRIGTLSGEDNKDASASGHFVSKKQNEL